MNKIAIFRFSLGWICLFVLPLFANAQVPQVINYQGRVAVSGTNFSGSGQFKFALVSGTSAATSYWSNDSTSSAGSQPTNSVLIPVTKGLYSVLLGDSTNMNVIPASVFSNGDVRLRVWFSDGSHGWQQLTPDQRIAAVGYAMMAGALPTGAVTSSMIASGAVGNSQLGSNAVQSGNIASGAVGSTQLASGAAATNLAGSNQSGITSGGLVMSPAENTALLNAGYVKIGTVTTADSWQQRVNGTLPTAREYHTAIWTGVEMIVWGGLSNSVGLNDGSRYNPASNSWTPIQSIGSPSARYYHSTVWTGTEMMVWGGFGGSSYLNDGARYNPITDTWTAVAKTGAPSVRAYHTGVWTGSELIVWGGQ